VAEPQQPKGTTERPAEVKSRQWKVLRATQAARIKAQENQKMPHQRKTSWQAKAINLAKVAGILAICLIAADFAVYLVEESNQKKARESARVMACYENTSAKGCEKEAAIAKRHQEQLEAKENQQRLDEEKEREAEARRREHAESMTATCAAIAMQHYTMSTTLQGKYILSNINWHDAGCRELFGGIRYNEIRNHSALPSNWASIDFDSAFPKKCWFVHGGDLTPCTHR
jgi:hypothetical protein